jgi:shikimate kinase
MARSALKLDTTGLVPLQRTIVLVGLMGAGKTTIGKRLATILQSTFVDSDQEIVEAAGCSISDIFEIYGEEMFRDLEQKVLLKILDRPPLILATGGGAFMNGAVREKIKQKATSVWLKAELEVLVERVSRRDSRPLLKKGDKRAILTKLMDERYPVYNDADIVIDSNNGLHESIVTRVVEAMKKNG